jgi:tetratricopeptide (TPR) repeat protein
MRRSCRQLQVLVLIVVCLILSTSAFAQAPSAIQVFMPNGGIPQRAIRLTLVRDDNGFPEVVFTDTNGKHRLATPRTQFVNYLVTIEGDRQTFATTAATFRLDRGIPNQVNIFLKPITMEKRPSDAVLDAANFGGNVPEKARAAYKRAMEAVSNGKLQAGISGLEQAINLYPQYVNALNDLGVIYLKLNEFEQAAVNFRKAIEIDKRFFHPRLNLGIVLSKQGKYQEAAEILGALYRENHGMLEVRLAYGKALRGAGELAEAEKIYRSTLESKNLEPQQLANLHFSLGVVLDRQSRYADAVIELDKAIALEDSANSHLQLGATLIQLQQFARAERELLRSYELGGGNSVAVAQSLLGQIYYRQQRFTDAQRAFERYLKDMPLAPDAPKINKLIAELKVTPRK